VNAPHLSLVLPCRDQGDHIGPLLRRYAHALQGLECGFEIIVVPNACRDDTLQIVRSEAEVDPQIRVLENSRGGWGLSVIVGLRAARGEVLCYTNSARTEPLDVVRLYRVYASAAPCIAKVRRVRRKDMKRQIGSWLYNVEGRVLLGVGTMDVNETPKIFSRHVYDRLDLAEEGDLIDLELLAKAKHAGVRVIEPEIEGFKRHGGKSRTNWIAAYRMYLSALRVRRQIRRIGA